MATTLELDPLTDRRLERLADETGRTKAFYIREMIDRGLEDVEDYYQAAASMDRVRAGKEPVRALEDVERELGLED